VEELRKTVLAMNPRIEIFPLSTRTGEGVTEFTGWLERKVTGK